MHAGALVIGLVAGLAAGAVFFGGLWWTTRRLPECKRPGLMMLASLVVRMSMVVGVFYLLSLYGRWEPMAAGLVGLITGRLAMVRHVKLAGKEA